MDKSRVYVRIDSQNRVVQIEGEYSLSNFRNLEECILIDEGFGDKYSLAQTHYLEKPLMTEEGVYQYKYADSTIVERTEEEIARDIAERPLPPPTPMERMEAQILYTALMTDTEIGE